MAKRLVFFIEDDRIVSKDFGFQWFAGFSLSQKRKSIQALHDAIRAEIPDARPLEISTKGEIPLGVKLSAFNLKLDGHYLECVFQSSKVFDDTFQPHREWLTLPPKEAKAAAAQLHGAGRKLVAFQYDAEAFPLEPKTAFYDHIYYRAVKEALSGAELAKLMQYDHFTDIEFSPKKSINTQARSIVLIKRIMERYGELPLLTNEEFLTLHKEYLTI
jgi:hypothetical protein